VEFQPKPPSTPASSAMPSAHPAIPPGPAPSSPSSPPLPSGFSGTGEWPPVPPAPAPTKPPMIGPEPPIINPDVHLIPVSAPPAGASGGSTLGVFTPGATTLSVTSNAVSTPADDSPTVAISSGLPTTPVPTPRRRIRPLRPTPPQPSAAEDSPLAVLQRSVRQQQAMARGFHQELVWQPRFAYTTAAVILLALTVVSLPLWIVLFRLVAATDAKIGDVMALVMLLMGGFLTSAAAWVIIIEMRGRVRMVDNLARSGDRELAVAPAAPELPVLDAPLDRVSVQPLRVTSGPAGWKPGQPPPPIESRVEAQQVSAATTLEASSKLLASFSSVLKSFGQLPAQVAMLTVALALFVGATILSLN
jgi:hypothetical protein